MTQQMAVKNLQGINDILDAEQLHYEKLETYASLAQGEQLKELIKDLKESSRQNFNSVYSYLKSHQS
jgi:histidyl-tRNA synthetase